MQVPVNGHSLPFLPALGRGYVTIEVCGDFLPRIQPIVGRSRRWRCARKCFAHRTLLISRPLARTPEGARHSNRGNGKVRHSTANRENGRHSAPCRLTVPSKVSDCVRTSSPPKGNFAAAAHPSRWFVP